ncbi:MAG: flippase-like domain-containing protein [Deltaproteobacteria bacterium]|nr:flippase-like domain-containing protein [Deltaproteobacteria bacterium]
MTTAGEEGPDAELRAAAPARPSRFRRAFRLTVTVAGAALLVVLIREVGIDELRGVLTPALPWLPLIAGLEALRIGCDALASRLALGPRGRAVPLRTYYVAQVVAHAVMNVFPAGRSASEAVKATLLAPALGGAPAAAMGYSNQANVLISSAAFTVLCLLGALASPEPQLLIIGLVAHTTVLAASGIGMRFAATSRIVAERTARHLPWLWRRVSRFHDVSRETPLISPKPIAVMFLGRAVQTAEYGVIAWAVGIDVGILEALAVQGTNLVAAAVGVLVPGQLGSAEAVFAAAAAVLGTTVARAMSIALLAHAVQLAWVVVGFGALLVFRTRHPTDD